MKDQITPYGASPSRVNTASNKTRITSRESKPVSRKYNYQDISGEGALKGGMNCLTIDVLRPRKTADLCKVSVPISM